MSEIRSISNRVFVLLGTLMPALAMASDMSGTFAITYGLLGMIMALPVFGTLALFRRLNRVVFIVAVVLFVPVAVFGVGMSADAMVNFGTRYMVYSLVYLAAFGLVCYCFLTIVRRYLQNKG